MPGNRDDGRLLASCLDEKEKKLLAIIKEVNFGEIRVIVTEGKPVRVEEIRKSIKL